MNPYSFPTTLFKQEFNCFGVIITHDTGFIYNIAKSTNKESIYFIFKYFSNDIILNNSVFVLYNHRTPHFLQLILLLENLGMIELFFPLNTSYFNAVEFVWRFFRIRMRKAMIEPHHQMITDQKFLTK